MRIQEKARGVGFDWVNKEQVWLKVEEEIRELQGEIGSQSSLSENNQEIENEFGDVLFSLINYARFVGINPEDALERTNKKFIKRFQFIEQEGARTGHAVTDMTLEEMEKLWNLAKEG